MELVLTAVLSIALGFSVGWLLAVSRGRRELDQARAAAQTAENEARAAAAADREALIRAEEQLGAQQRATAEAANAFKAHAGEALSPVIEQLRTLNEEQLKAALESGGKDLDARKQAIAELLKPLGDGLRKLDEHGRELEKKRVEAYTEVRQQFAALSKSTQELNQHSHALATALKGSSRARGRWGEIALKRIVELAGMTEHCDFDEQVQTADGMRPDLLVHMPGGGAIPVDAKVPLEDYMKSCEAEDDSVRKTHLKAHARALRGFVDALRKKDYASQIEGPVDFTVLFVPADAVLSAAFSVEPEIQQNALENRVLITTPVTLMALLRTVGLYWRHEQLAENAEHMAGAAHELYKRVAKFTTHFAKVGKGLQTASSAYNDAVGSYKRRVIPAGRTLEKLGGQGGALPSIEAPPDVETTVRSLVAPADADEGRDDEQAGETAPSA
jgi:DNA recombination protein RmuC